MGLSFIQVRREFYHCNVENSQAKHHQIVHNDANIKLLDGKLNPDLHRNFFFMVILL